MKIEENEKIYIYQDFFIRELKKKLWNMKVKVILFAVGVLGTITKDFEKKQEGLEIRGRIKSIQTIAFLGSAIEKCPGHLRRLSVTQISVKKNTSSRW